MYGSGWNGACRLSTDVGTWTNWLTFEPDPDYSPDAGTGLLSPISYAMQHWILLRRENFTYRYWAPVAAARRGYKLAIHREPWEHHYRRYIRSTECLLVVTMSMISLLRYLASHNGVTFKSGLRSPLDRSRISSYWRSMETMALSCIISKMNQNILVENRDFFHTPPAPLGVPVGMLP